MISRRKLIAWLSCTPLAGAIAWLRSRKTKTETKTETEYTLIQTANAGTEDEHTIVRKVQPFVQTPEGKAWLKKRKEHTP